MFFSRRCARSVHGVCMGSAWVCLGVPKVCLGVPKVCVGCAWVCLGVDKKLIFFFALRAVLKLFFALRAVYVAVKKLFFFFVLRGGCGLVKKTTFFPCASRGIKIFLRASRGILFSVLQCLCSVLNAIFFFALRGMVKVKVSVNVNVYVKERKCECECVCECECECESK